ncbi:Ig-like domain-containing protein [Scandinavium goeteborgense]|uniref:Bacterial Ig-like domain-containing protein n=1 Tax=Scandinavium goeteborgense TaxID=1851514 RepID=A0A4R6DQZ3_SCAGO|nr:Ig-like domain-containing protein [Scandinavium goeteborgense]TDN47450.1 hypothetical protein EC847_13217 [Scandinavium goeteborgense]
MESKTINLVVVEGKKIEKTVELHQGSMTGPVTVDAVDNGKYILAEDGTGFAPENITVTRVGDDLYISLEGDDKDHPDLIIRDYYLNEGELVGKGEDGAYYDYVSSQGQDSAVLVADSTEPLALGNDSIPGLGEGLIADNDSTLLWALLGVGALAVAGGAIALANHHSDNHHSTTESSGGDGGGAVTVASGKLDAITDNVGSITGPIADKGVTDDSKPTFSGSGVDAGDTVYILDTDDSVIGSTTAQQDGTWSFTPGTALADGAHDIKVVVVDPDGNQSGLSNDINIVVDTVAPAAAENVAVEGDTNTPAITGDAEANTVVVISDNGTVIGSAQVDGDGKWSFTPTVPLADGDHDITTVVVDEAGNTSPESPDIPFTLGPDDNGGDGGDDATAPDAATDILVTNDAGDSISGKESNDNTPDISGKAEPGTVVIISDNGKEIGSAQVDGDGNWKFMPTDPLADGDHDISTVVKDADGNESVPSADVDFTVDTVAPAAAANLDLEDDYGTETGPIAENAKTDDATPIFSGTAEPDSTVIVYDNNEVIGSVHVDHDGNWSFTPAKALVDGDHSFTTAVEDAAGNRSPTSDAMDFTVDTSNNPVVSTGFEDFDSAAKMDFDTLGQSLHLDSGMTITLVSGPITGVGAANHEFTSINSRGVALIVPAFGKNTLEIVENSDVKFAFDEPTTSVSFDTNGSSFNGTTVTYYDASGNELSTQDIPPQTDGFAVQTISWSAPAGETIGSIMIHTSPGSGNNVSTRFDNFSFGADDAVASTYHAPADVQSLAEHYTHGLVALDYSALAADHQTPSDSNVSQASQQGIVVAHGHEQLDIDTLLSHAVQNMFIDDGKEQVAITGDADSHVEFDVSALGFTQDWSSEGHTIAGGMVYDVYQQHDSNLELLIQHGLDVQHA